MKKIFLITLVLIASIVAGTLMAKNPGYLLIIYGETSIETSLWIALIMFAIGFILIQIIFKLLIQIITSPKKIHGLIDQHKAKRSIAYTAKSLNDALEERWYNAEKNMIKAIPGSNVSAFNYVAAAKAAQQQQEFKRRDRYLTKAKQLTAKNQISTELAQIHLQISATQWQQALTNLQNLYQQNLARKHPIILKLFCRVLTQLKDWDSLYKIYPEISRNSTLTKQQLSQLEISMFQGMLKASSEKNDSQQLKSIWKNMPRRLHHCPQTTAVYVDKLIANGQDQQAEHMLTTCLKSQIYNQLLMLYGKLKPQNPHKHLQHAEKWLKSEPNHPALLVTLGKICIEQQLWGKARHYLEQAQAIKPSKEACTLLAKMCELLGEQEQALLYYREGIENANSLF